MARAKTGGRQKGKSNLSMEELYQQYRRKHLDIIAQGYDTYKVYNYAEFTQAYYTEKEMATARGVQIKNQNIINNLVTAQKVVSMSSKQAKGFKSYLNEYLNTDTKLARETRDKFAKLGLIGLNDKTKKYTVHNIRELKGKLSKTEFDLLIKDLYKEWKKVNPGKETKYFSMEVFGSE